MTKQMEVFRSKLEEFAMNHRSDIRKNAQFRRQFQEMCASIGVDPLSSGKGFWSELGMGDFYYELGVQVVEVCLAANHSTGGLMELNELRKRLVAARGSSAVHQELTNDDILMAAKKLSNFGNGFIIYSIGAGRYMVQSIPGELSLDETSILTSVSNQGDGFTTTYMLVKQLGWTEFRAKQALDKIVGECGDLEVTLEFLTELDKLVQLIESPIFASLRLTLVSPSNDGVDAQYLAHDLYGILMLLPQTESFIALKNRLQCVPNYWGNLPGRTKKSTQEQNSDINFEELYNHFVSIQKMHRQQRMAQRKRSLWESGTVTY